MKLIARDLYLRRLISSEENGMVKIITGLRRCGKSFLLFRLYHDHLLSRGVAPDHILEYSLEDLTNVDLLDPRALLAHI